MMQQFPAAQAAPPQAAAAPHMPRLPFDRLRAWLEAAYDRLAASTPEQLLGSVLISAAVVALAAALIWGAGWATDRFVRRRDPVGESEAGRAVARPAAIALKRLAWVVVGGGALYLLLLIWGLIPAGDLNGADLLISHILRLALIFGLAALAWRALGPLVGALVDPLHAHGKERSARARSVGPVLVGAGRLLIVTLALLLALAELGLDITPLLAGAGILGLAVGFGAQSLVKDFLTGLMILIENSMAVGDVVQLGDHSGTVETMGVRTVRLRDIEGTLHILPYSEISVIQNLSKDYAFAVFDVAVAYEADLDLVFASIREAGERLQADAVFAPKILEPVEIMGLDRFDDNAVIIKARIKTRPGGRWSVMRGFNRLLKQQFDAAGIEIPYPQRTLHVKGTSADVAALFSQSDTADPAEDEDEG